MSSGVRYQAVIDGVSISAICDIFYLKPPAAAAIVIHEIFIRQETSETSEQLPLQIFRTATDNWAVGTANTPVHARWDGGVTSQGSGTIRYGTIELKGADRLRVLSCALGRVYCTSADWVRVSRARQRVITQGQLRGEPRS